MSMVYRGFPLTIDDERHARALLAGGQVATDVLLTLISESSLGVWWTSEVGEVYSHAEAISGDYDLSIKGAVEAADRGEGFYGAETCIVLAANAPTVWEQEDWEVPDGSPIDLVSIKYTIDPMDDTAWRTVPVGRTLTAGAAGDLPEGLTFEVTQGTWKGERAPKRWVTAHLDGRQVGHLGWWTDPVDGHAVGEIVHVEVVGHLQRRGIASAMLARAREDEPRVHHSTALSDDGKAWAKKVGSRRTYFHLAPTSARESIREHGLDQSRGQSRWADAPVGFSNFPKGNYLFETRAAAEAYAVPGQSFDLWEVDPTDLPIEADPLGTPEAVMVTEPIPASALRHAGEVHRPFHTAALPSGIRFETTVMPDYLRQKQPIGGTVYAFLDGGNAEELKYPYLKDCVGILRWYSSGEIDSAWVHPDLRRQGLATDLLRRAREADPTVHHSETLTPAGRAWREKVGGLNGDLPTDLRYEVEDFSFPEAPEVRDLGWNPGYGIVAYSPSGDRVGELYWLSSNSQIVTAIVADGWRRRGIASELLRRAREMDPKVHHSTNLSPDGKAWSEKVGSVAGLVFEHEQSQTGGSKWPVQHDLIAMLDGVEVGRLTYLTGTRANSKVLIDSLDVDDRFRRRGIASALMDEMQERHPGASVDHGDRTDDGKSWWSGYTRGKSVTRGRTMASLSGLTFTHHPGHILSEGGALKPADYGIQIDTMLATDASGVVGGMSWYSGDFMSGGVDALWVRPERRRQGVATALLAEVRKIVPDLDPYRTPWITDDGSAFLSAVGSRNVTCKCGEQVEFDVQDGWQGLDGSLTCEAGGTHGDHLAPLHTAGPASDMVPFERFPILRPAHFGPRDVTVLRMARKDIDRLHPGQQRKVEEVIESLRLGTARIEPKERAPLVGSYTVRVTNSLRLGLYLSEDQPGGDPDADWIVYWVGDHNYAEAERRMQRNASLEVTASFTLDSDWSPGARQTKWKARASDGRVAGYVLFREGWDKDDEGDFTYAAIDMIETNPAYARQGVAAFLYRKLKDTYDEVRGTGEFTPEGAAWWKKMTGEDVTPNARSSQPRGRDWTYASRRTASDAVYYHGTSAALAPGAKITPKEPLHDPGSWDTAQARRGPSERWSDPAVAYATSSMADAWWWAEHAYNAGRGDHPRVYQVRPLGPVFPDPNNEFEGDVVSPVGFEVVSEVTEGEDFEFWKEGGLKVTAADLMLGQDVYYRTHDRMRAFSVGDAWSAPLRGSLDEDPQEGYSALPDPWSLWGYVTMQGWTSFTFNDDVLIFSGTEVGTGHDGEPLVVPDKRIERWVSWRDFLRELSRNVSTAPWSVLWKPNGYETPLLEVAANAYLEDPHDPVAQRIIVDNADEYRMMMSNSDEEFEEWGEGIPLPPYGMDVVTPSDLGMMFASRQKTMPTAWIAT